MALEHGMLPELLDRAEHRIAFVEPADHEGFLDLLRNHTADYVCCIYATAPFVRPEFLNEGYEIITREKVSSVFSVTSFPFPIFRALKINQSGGLEMYWPEHELTRSNDLPEAFHDAGQFYWVERASFLQEERLYSKDSRPVVIPRKWVQDIDTPEDWATAESMYRALAFEEAAE